jgi:gamma-glutamylputrescine oxidase
MASVPGNRQYLRSEPLTGQSYWQRHGGAPVPEVTPGPTLVVDMPERGDYAIVGGGFAGLSTALRLADAEPGARIVLLEARFLGFGASGRNAGLLSPLPAPIWIASAATNAEHAWGLRHLNLRVGSLARWLEREAPASEVADAVLQIESQGHLFSTGLARVAAILGQAGLEHRTGKSPDGDVVIELAAHVLSPYRTVRALADAAGRRGVSIREGAAVSSIEENDTGVVIALADSRRLQARRAVVCSNAYTTSIRLPEQPRARSVLNFMVATETIDAASLGDKGDPRRFGVEINGSYVYWRHHAGRIVYGGIERLQGRDADDFAVPPDVLAKLEHLVSRSFPSAALTPVEAWSGVYHQTLCDLPVIRRTGTRGDIVLNVGYGGTGVAMSQICATLAAAIARGIEPTDADDRRLLAAISDTRLPIGGAVRFLAGVTKDLLLGRRPPAA